jgi:hypothetical protein
LLLRLLALPLLLVQPRLPLLPLPLKWLLLPLLLKPLRLPEPLLLPLVLPIHFWPLHTVLCQG